MAISTYHALRPIGWLVRVLWLEKVYKPFQYAREASRPARHRFLTRYIKAPGHVAWTMVAATFVGLSWILSKLWDLIEPIVKSKYVWPVLAALGTPLGIVGGVLGLVAWGIGIGIWYVLKALWFLIKIAAYLSWLPIHKLGGRIYEDPDWDWIFLWNITAPFPRMFPRLFGQPRERPRTKHEWTWFQTPDFEREAAMPAIPYDKWIARMFPDEATPFLNAECWLDIPMDMKEDLSVICMPVLRRFRIYGLILQRTGKEGNTYERVGMFECSKYESCFAWTKEAMQKIILT